MALNSDAKQYADLLIAEAVKDTTRRREEALKKIELLPRGGGRDASIAKAHIDCIEALARAYVDSYLKAYARSNTLFSELEARQLADHIEKLVTN